MMMRKGVKVAMCLLLFFCVAWHRETGSEGKIAEEAAYDFYMKGIKPFHIILIWFKCRHDIILSSF